MKTSATNDIIKAILPVLEKGGAKKAILFGSYARGDADEYSDIDLIIGSGLWVPRTDATSKMMRDT